jgi:CheY-like chemotaxis protein
MTMKTFRILIAEDKEEELSRAVKIAEELGFEVVTAKDASSASRLATKTNWPTTVAEKTTFTPLVDAVVTDIFMPYDLDSEMHREATEPCGLLVQAAAKAAEIPCAFCTGGYHHGRKFQWIHTMATYIDCGMLDSGRGEETDAPKRWKEVLEMMKGILERSHTEAN